MRGNPAAGILLLIAGIVGFLALLSGNLDKWINKTTQGTGNVFSLGAGASMSSGSSGYQPLPGGIGSRSSADTKPPDGLRPGPCWSLYLARPRNRHR